MIYTQKSRKSTQDRKKRNHEKKKAYNQQYRHDFLKSRKKDEYDTFFCEYPGCGGLAVDIHHINSSYRGQRTHNTDGSDLIALCRNCHEEVHGNNTNAMRDKLYAVVSSLIF